MNAPRSVGIDRFLDSFSLSSEMVEEGSSFLWADTWHTLKDMQLEFAPGFGLITVPAVFFRMITMQLLPGEQE